MKMAILAVVSFCLGLANVVAVDEVAPAGKYVLFGTNGDYRMEPIAVEISESGNARFIAAIGNPGEKTPIEFVNDAMFFSFREPAFSGSGNADNVQILSFAAKLDSETKMFKGVVQCLKFGQYVLGAAIPTTGNVTLFPFPSGAE